MSRRRAGRAGFTLLEMMVAMTVLAMLGTLLVQLVDGSFDLYEQGTKEGEIAIQGEVILEMLAEDLAAVHGGPEGRLLIQPHFFGKGAPLIRIVRTIPGGEMNHPVLRRAGTATGASQRWNGGDVPDEERAALAPPAGLMEVAWALIQRPEDPIGVLTLHRAEGTPALGAGGFFDPRFGEDLSEEMVATTFQPMGSDVLGLWIVSLSQDSVDWDETLALEGRPARDGGLVAWDSTRGILPKDTFPLARGEASLADPRDDVFPRRCRLVAAMARGRTPDTRLRSGLLAGATRLPVRASDMLPPDSSEDRFVKVGNEWMELLPGARGAATPEVRRGARGTKGDVGGQIGASVYLGRTTRRTLGIPAARSYWTEEGR